MSKILWHPLQSHRHKAYPVLNEVFTLPEVGRLLRVTEKTVYTMAQRREMPAFNVRGRWRPTPADIDAWIEQPKLEIQK